MIRPSIAPYVVTVTAAQAARRRGQRPARDMSGTEILVALSVAVLVVALAVALGLWVAA